LNFEFYVIEPLDLFKNAGSDDFAAGLLSFLQFLLL